MKILIRQTRFLDIKQLMEVNQNSLSENYEKEFWDKKFYEGKTHSFVAIGMGKVIGYAFCDETTIISFAIEKEFRGKGIGKQLLAHCLNSYKTPVKLHVRVSNEPALKLYKSFGFVEKETLKEYYTTLPEIKSHEHHHDHSSHCCDSHHDKDAHSVSTPSKEGEHQNVHSSHSVSTPSKEGEDAYLMEWTPSNVKYEAKYKMNIK